MKTKTLREQVRLLLEIIQDDDMDAHEALGFLSDGEALARWGITNQDAVDIVFDSIADDDDDFYNMRSCADREAIR